MSHIYFISVINFYAFVDGQDVRLLKILGSFCFFCGNKSAFFCKTKFMIPTAEGSFSTVRSYFTRQNKQLSSSHLAILSKVFIFSHTIIGRKSEKFLVEVYKTSSQLL